MMIAPFAFCDRFGATSGYVSRTYVPPLFGTFTSERSGRAAPKQVIGIIGLAELPIRGVSFENVQIVAEQV